MTGDNNCAAFEQEKLGQKFDINTEMPPGYLKAAIRVS